MFHPCHLLLYFPISHSFFFGRPSLSCCDIHATLSSPSATIHALFLVRPFTLYFFSTLSTTGNSSRQLAVAYRELSHVITVFRKASFLHLYCCHKCFSHCQRHCQTWNPSHIVSWQHSLYIELKDNDTDSALETCFLSLHTWFSANTEKSKAIIFSGKKRWVSTSQHTDVDSKITVSSKIKSIGVTRDKWLTFAAHITGICQKITSHATAVRHIKKCLT